LICFRSKRDLIVRNDRIQKLLVNSTAEERLRIALALETLTAYACMSSAPDKNLKLRLMMVPERSIRALESKNIDIEKGRILTSTSTPHRGASTSTPSQEGCNQHKTESSPSMPRTSRVPSLASLIREYFSNVFH